MHSQPRQDHRGHARDPQPSQLSWHADFACEKRPSRAADGQRNWLCKASMHMQHATCNMQRMGGGTQISTGRNVHAAEPPVSPPSIPNYGAGGDRVERLGRGAPAVPAPPGSRLPRGTRERLGSFQELHLFGEVTGVKVERRDSQKKNDNFT